MIVRNALSRPVEIHFADRVAVMLPGEKLRLEEAELSDAAVRPLVQSGTLACFEAPPDPAPRAARPRKPRMKLAKPAKGGAPVAKPDPAPAKKAPAPSPAPALAPRRKTKGRKKPVKLPTAAPDNAEQTETSR
jgi:hypothetical protein